jgi:hypothetical protein
MNSSGVSVTVLCRAARGRLGIVLDPVVLLDHVIHTVVHAPLGGVEQAIVVSKMPRKISALQSDCLTLLQTEHHFPRR